MALNFTMPSFKGLGKKLRRPAATPGLGSGHKISSLQLTPLMKLSAACKHIYIISAFIIAALAFAFALGILYVISGLSVIRWAQWVHRFAGLDAIPAIGRITELASTGAN
eukprot:gnl/TRDRNA2_/TRDRNA2_106760_c0_seq1.p2 gnl/TRDRNA2_/TRDRNA2_106760_c0~~gnl/TRDRNA2_/TRDRNA2_106760_c0_seq1.p2  ORF type:complete len:110 (-),score=11.07 gnl/TRDRNA2_/TRDRNA2_106760_c0_seq1:231-560(-)